jgi:UDP-GlcNAc:undecaprenyl-phosphate GlcNAc-1-phosphate transferase
MGGIAIFLGTTAAWLMTAERRAVVPVAVPAAVVFLLGFLDDRVELPAARKLAGQVVAGALLIAGGVTYGGLPALLALPISLVWVVGVTNAVNFVDNMDGLAAGSSLLSALFLAAYCAAVGAPETAAAALALAGGCTGFLLYNVNPAKVFMGDCGSLFVGFSLAALALQGTRGAPNFALALLVTTALLAFPLFDLVLVSVVRTLRGRSILERGWESISYRLVALGLSQRRAVLVLYGLTTLFGGVALAAARLPLIVVVILATLLWNTLVALGVFLSVPRR